MKLDFNLQLQQEQKLIMTEELQLAVKMLQLTSMELNEYVDEQIAENPMLERDETVKDEEGTSFDNKIDNIVDISYEDNNEYQDVDEDQDYISPLNFATKDATLWDYLKEQLFLTPVNPKKVKILEYIIDNINENGYLTVDTKNISERFSISLEESEKMINIIQAFDPSGICARDISECLIIQLRNKDIHDAVLEDIIKSHLLDVGEKNVKKLSSEYNITIEQSENYIDIIKSFDPKPGIRYCSDTTRYVEPDVYIENNDGKYTVRINNDIIPPLKINNIYKRLMHDKKSPDYRYVKGKLESAVWIIKSIEQRIQTIKKVVEAIVDYQIDFFEKQSDLKPLTLKQISDATGLHISTVSRAVKGKYVQTDRGLFEIKSFFIRGFQDKSGEEISTPKIKQRIMEIIEGENKNKPNSDDKIAKMLNNEGVDISRRTVAKYREELFIPSSSKRKR